MMIEDTALLRRYADEKSEAAFAELVQRRIGLVYSVALRQVGGDAHLAEDVTQRVFADLARKAAALSERPVLSGWLYRSAQFAASDLVRAERRRRAREEETQIMNEPFAADAAVDWEKVRPVLDETLGELADEDRDAVALRFFENRPFAEIGRALSISEDTARKRVDRALDKLHAQLARRGVNSTTAALGLALVNQASAAAPTGLAASVTGVALASGVVGAGASVIATMGTAKIALGIGSALAILAVGSAVYESRQASRTEAELTAAKHVRATLTARLADADGRAQRAEKRAEDAEKDSGELLAAIAALQRKQRQSSDSRMLAVENRSSEQQANNLRDSKRTIVVSGQVKQPGTYALPPSGVTLTLKNLLVQSTGGFGDIANRNKIRVSRLLSNGTMKIFTLTLADAETFAVEANDIVYVPERLL